MSQAPASKGDEPVWRPEPRAWGRGDIAAIAAWTAAVAAYFWPAVSLREALFYFDVSEINYAYRDFFARELRAGRFSRWFPGLYCGLPLYSESQAGYLHPLKYLLYPWLPTWQAFNLDTVLSIWLTGLGTYGWLRRHVGAAGALTGAAVFGLGGFVWAHVVHTSMINALASVPLVVWALEVGWERGRWWPIVLGSLALACQVFAGHLQDTILTSGLVMLYAAYRAATERGLRQRISAIGMAAGLIALGGALAAVQWIPSKELLDRSPRAGGLTWQALTYGSWHPELLPTLVVREAYGTFARDTDWMDGFYPYHEMNAYLGAVALALAVLGGLAYRDRWVAFWVLLTGVSGVLMLGRFTLVFDVAHRIPVFGSSRIPVRYHLWASLAVAALAGIGVDRLSRPGTVRLRAAVAAIATLVALSVPILVYVYMPVWTEPSRWTSAYHLARYRWLGNELIFATARTGLIVLLAWLTAVSALRAGSSARRGQIAALLPLLVIADLLGSHAHDVPTITPRYWTVPPASAVKLRADPSFQRVFGIANRASNEPGFASEPVDFLSVRDTLDWSLPPIWGLSSSQGETPIIPRRLLEYTDTARPGAGRFDVESVTHIVQGVATPNALAKPEVAGSAYIYRNPGALPRARLMGRPVYAMNEQAAIAALARLGASIRDQVVVEDPDRPLAESAVASGTATITRDLPEDVEVRTRSTAPAYLVLVDSYDPGWSATLDGRPVPVRPAFVAFRAVFVPSGEHTVVFRYTPAGFTLGLTITALGVLAGVVLFFWNPATALEDEHAASRWSRRWPLWGVIAVGFLFVVSTIRIEPGGRASLHPRWADSVHRFTWGAGLEAMYRMRPAPGADPSFGPSHP